jgi:PAS domain S-box-containing protein
MMQKQLETLIQDDHIFRCIFDQHTAMMLLSDLQTGKILEANQTAASFFGYPQTKLHAMRLSDLNILPVGLLERGGVQSWAEKKENTIATYEGANGRGYVLEVQPTIVSLRGLSVLFLMIQDITTRAQETSLLRESEWQHRLVSEMMSDYVVVVDVERGGGLKLRWASENMSRVTGRTMAEAQTSDLWQDIIHPEDLGKFFCVIQQTLATGKPAVFTCRAFVKSGAERWVQINVVPQLDDNGAVVVLLGAIKDISVQVRAQESLRESEEEYRILIEESSDPIFSFSVEGQ